MKYIPSGSSVSTLRIFNPKLHDTVLVKTHWPEMSYIASVVDFSSEMLSYRMLNEFEDGFG